MKRNRRMVPAAHTTPDAIPPEILSLEACTKPDDEPAARSTQWRFGEKRPKVSISGDGSCSASDAFAPPFGGRLPYVGRPCLLSSRSVTESLGTFRRRLAIKASRRRGPVFSDAMRAEQDQGARPADGMVRAKQFTGLR
jgi:hypothetical protein